MLHAFWSKHLSAHPMSSVNNLGLCKQEARVMLKESSLHQRMSFHKLDSLSLHIPNPEHYQSPPQQAVYALKSYAKFQRRFVTMWSRIQRLFHIKFPRRLQHLLLGPSICICMITLSIRLIHQLKHKNLEDLISYPREDHHSVIEFVDVRITALRWPTI